MKQNLSKNMGDVEKKKPLNAASIEEALTLTGIKENLLIIKL